MADIEISAETKAPLTIHSIPITDTVSLAYDPGDNWFAVADSDNFGYDALGVVIMGMDELDALIVALGRLRELRK